jgi:hypothetical protein
VSYTPAAVAAFIRSRTRKGDAEGVRSCGCSHPWGLHAAAAPHRCLCSTARRRAVRVCGVRHPSHRAGDVSGANLPVG